MYKKQIYDNNSTKEKEKLSVLFQGHYTTCRADIILYKGRNLLIKGGYFKTQDRYLNRIKRSQCWG